MELNRKNVRTIMLIITFTVLLYLGVQRIDVVISAFRYAFLVIRPVVTGACLAFVLCTVMNLFEKRVLFWIPRHLKKYGRSVMRTLSIVLTLLVFLGAVLLLSLIVLPETVSALYLLLERLPGFATDLINWARELMLSFNVPEESIPIFRIDWDGFTRNVTDFLRTYSGNLLNAATTITVSVAGGIFDGVMTFVIAIYMMAQKERITGVLTRLLKAFLPQKLSSVVLRVSSMTHAAFFNFVTGQLTEALILGLLCFFGMLIFRFPYAPVISTVVGVSALVPIIGAWVGAIIGGLLILTIDAMRAFMFIVFLLILQQIEGNVIYPKVVGKSIGVPGLIVMIAVIIGGNVGGVPGILLAVPVCSVLLALLQESLFSREKEMRARASDAAP